MQTKVNMSSVNSQKLILILPTYNAEKTIIRAIDSVLTLLDDPCLNVELYIVDDYSSDGTFKIINEHYSKISNIKILRNEKNEGPGKTRNSALEKITDGYIGFIDSDDELNPVAYKKAFLDGLNKIADLITFDAAFMSTTRSLLRYDYHRLSVSKFERIRNCIRGDLDGSVIFSIYKKSTLDILGVRFSSNYYEDIVFNYSALMSFETIHIAKEICYRKHDTLHSIVNSISEKHIDGMIDASALVRDFAVRNGYSEYNQFKSDFDYGLSGYIASLIAGILMHEKRIDQSMNLLKYLFNKLDHCYNIQNIVVRNETKKDKLSNFFINNFDISSPNTTIDVLNKLIRL
jgi:glycosyltransferase involved in cell wall biosynthesis